MKHRSPAQHVAAPVEIRVLERIGSGTFGTVYRGSMRCRASQGVEEVAVKTVELDRNYINREVEIMQELTAAPHPNIVALKHSHLETDARGKLTCFMAMDLFPMNLSDVIFDWSKRGRSSEWKTKLYMYQATRALAHIHGMSIVHRDVKPENMLVNPRTGVLKICDFGSSKRIVPGNGEVHTTYIASRFYRAPELLLQNEAYGPEIDIWALGCCLAEMIRLRPLFAGADSVDQLYLVMKGRGTPTYADFEALNPTLEIEAIETLLMKPRPACSWRMLLKTSRFSQSCEALLERLLSWSPAVRPEARHALAEEYFTKIRESDCQKSVACELFNFTEEELSAACTPTMSGDTHSR